LQFEEIADLQSIDSESNMRDPFVSDDVAGMGGYFAE
jgi:hypothetical protein